MHNNNYDDDDDLPEKADLSFNRIIAATNNCNIRKTRQLWQDHFTVMCEKNELMTEEQVNKLVNNLTYGKSRSCLLAHRAGSDILSMLTHRHILTAKQVALVIRCIDGGKLPDDFSFQWVDNLLSLGCKFSNEHYNKLIVYGYKAGINTIMSKNEATLDDLNVICKSGQFNALDAFIKKFKVAPDLSTINILAKQDIGDIQKQNVIIKLVQHERFPLSVELIKSIFSVIDLRSISDYVANLFNLHKITRFSDIRFIFRNPVTLREMCNINYLVTMCHDRNVTLDDEYLKIIMMQTVISTCLITTEVNLVLKNNIKLYRCTEFDGRHNDTYKYLDNYYDVVSKFVLASTNRKALLEHSCLVDDRLTFDIIVKHLNTATEKCLLNACASGSFDMIKILLDMKILPTIECIRSMKPKYINKDIFYLLLKYGLPVNLEVVEACLIKGIYIQDLHEHGYKPDIELYKICYKYNDFPKLYVDQLKKNPAVNMNIRLAISRNMKANDNANKSTKKNPDEIECPVYTVEEIIQMMKDNHVVPDYMMYTHAVATKNTRLVEYFEKEFGMKPTISALILINNENDRREYLDRILKCHDVPSELLTTHAEKN
jgi:hypothetical protein